MRRQRPGAAVSLTLSPSIPFSDCAPPFIHSGLDHKTAVFFSRAVPFSHSACAFFTGEFYRQTIDKESWDTLSNENTKPVSWIFQPYSDDFPAMEMKGPFVGDGTFFTGLEYFTRWVEMLCLSCKLMDFESVGDFSVSEFSHFVIKLSHLPGAKPPKKSVMKAQDFNAG